jgi:UPF0755 protein
VSSVLRLIRRVMLWAVLIGAIAAAAAGWWLWQDYQRFAQTPLEFGSEELVLEIRRGDSMRQVLRRLRQLGINQGHDLYWEALAFDLEVTSRLQVGEYSISHGITPTRLLQKLEQGLVIQHRFTLVEGWSFEQVRAALAAEPALAQTLEGLGADEVMARLGEPGMHPEGLFLPETYLFTRGTEDIALLRRAREAMRRALDDVWATRQQGLPFDTPYEALILASLIEKETGVPHERDEIAGVFVRRLRLGMRLQTDPTIIYGMGAAYTGRIRRVDLQTDTPYNTYTRHGLTPTPIAMPGRASLQAAVNPKPGDTLYFVSKGDGSHHFSRTLVEHNRAVNRYIRGRGNGGTP